MIALLAAPTNLGLRPPVPGSVPGCAKAPEALKDAGLLGLWSADAVADAGTVIAGRYVDDADAASGRVRNQTGLIAYSRRLADRVTALLDAHQTPFVVGGDCSLLLGVGLALRRRGRYALVHIDGHTDFRNPENSPVTVSAAGEDLAIVVGRHWPEIADIDGHGPYFDPADVVHAGCREGDEHLEEARGAIKLVVPASDLIADQVAATEAIVSALSEATVDGYWIHVDLDVLDPGYMPAVDSPDPGGMSPDGLGRLLARLAPEAIGCDIAIYDPDLDPTGEHAATVVDVVRHGLTQLGEDRGKRPARTPESSDPPGG